MLQLHHISKTFGRGATATRALTDVSLTIRPGTATALLGENGAGKTTLMNVLTGLVRPDTGEITLDSVSAAIHRPQDARRLKIGMVHQHFMLVEPMSVAENVALHLSDLGWRVDPGAIMARVAAAARQYRLDIAPDVPVERLSVGQRQRVEILKTLMQEVRYLILDEPTAVLTPQEAEELFAIIRHLCARGVGVVFITHRLAEVSAVCRYVTVLRRGVVTHEGTVDEHTTPAQLAEWMVGENAPVSGRAGPGELSVGTGVRPRISVVLRVENLTVPSPHRKAKPLVEGASLQICAGEVLGVAGVDGNGQRELCEALCGLRKATGQVLLAGQDISRWSADQRFAAGVAHIADDRQREGLILHMTLADNLALKAHDRPGFSRWGWISVRSWRGRAKTAIRDYNIRTAGPGAPVGSLSGGNQQKVILARELGLKSAAPAVRPRLVVAMNPARGLDVSATRFVYEQITRLRNDGAGVLLVAADLDELFEWCDRLAVMHAGRWLATEWPKTTRTEIGELMLGEKAEENHVGPPLQTASNRLRAGAT